MRLTSKKTLIFNGILSFIFSACTNTQLFYSNEAEVAQDEAGVYTELKLNENGSFEEYMYYSIGGTDEDVDFGSVILGDYSFEKDTLFLVYTNYSKGNDNFPELINGKYHEAYVLRKGKLTKLQPVTYSSHFVNLVMNKGKAKQLRDRANYNDIIWKINYSNDSTFTLIE